VQAKQTLAISVKRGESHSARNHTKDRHLDPALAPERSGSTAGKPASTKVAIQLEGFTVSRSCRTYNFRVTDAPGEFRQFSVHVLLEWFRATPLKFQDGPLLTLERLKQELDRETGDSHAQASLSVGKPDIVEYLERHYPPKARTWHPVLPARMSH
jgi:hypothetical protein